jgi:hypothetical protein
MQFRTRALVIIASTLVVVGAGIAIAMTVPAPPPAANASSAELGKRFGACPGGPNVITETMGSGEYLPLVVGWYRIEGILTRDAGGDGKLDLTTVVASGGGTEPVSKTTMSIPSGDYPGMDWGFSNNWTVWAAMGDAATDGPNRVLYTIVVSDDGRAFMAGECSDRDRLAVEHIAGPDALATMPTMTSSEVRKLLTRRPL